MFNFSGMVGCFGRVFCCSHQVTQRSSRKSSDMHLKLNVVLCLKKVVPGLCFLQAVQASKRVRGGQRRRERRAQRGQESGGEREGREIEGEREGNKSKDSEHVCMQSDAPPIPG